jgi:hypothetical protein
MALKPVYLLMAFLKWSDQFFIYELFLQFTSDKAESVFFIHVS